jgi:hypothetical protein
MFVIFSLGLGAISAWLTAELHLAIQNWTEYVFISWTLWFVVPVGGFVIGGLGAVGVTFTNVFREKDAPGTGAIIGAVIGLLSWYLAYRVAADAYGFDSIFDYMQVLADSSISLGVEINHHHAHGELPPIPPLAALSMIVQPIGAIAGGFCAGVIGAIKDTNPATATRAPSGGAALKSPRAR